MGSLKAKKNLLFLSIMGAMLTTGCSSITGDGTSQNISLMTVTVDNKRRLCGSRGRLSLWAGSTGFETYSRAQAKHGRLSVG